VLAYTLALFAVLAISTWHAQVDRCGDCTAFSCSQHPRLVLVINLRRRQDRWRHIYRRLRANTGLLSYRIERQEAVDGSHSLDFARMVVDGSLRHRAFESVMSKQRRVWGQELTTGAVGCLLSHANAWKRSLRLNQSVLVIEDDVELISPAFEDTFPRALNKLPHNFGLLYLGDMAKDTETIHRAAYSSDLDRISRPLWGTYAYVVSSLAARRLLLHMYPADAQVDSYIKQVAELYAADMPNFVVSQDLVYTDNSETRVTDAQQRGENEYGDARKNLQLRYHVLLPSIEFTGSTTFSGETNDRGSRLLTFDHSYSSSLNPSEVSHHSEQAAIAYAISLGILTPAQAASDSAVGNRHQPARRWLLCAAIAMRHGGLCFTEPFTIVRNMQHMLDQVSFGIFMASMPTAVASETTMSQVVYAARLMSRSNADFVILALRNALGNITASTGRNTGHHRDFFELIHVTLPVVATRFPPHIFDPMLPLQRPCRCSPRTSSDHGRDIACQSRCERSVAPPHAVGFPSLRPSALPGLSHATPRLLHIIESVPKVPTGQKNVMARQNSELWKRLHAPPKWDVRVVRSNKIRHTPQYGLIDEACLGLIAVAKYGGAYVNSNLPPRRALSRGALSGWSTNSAPVVAISEDAGEHESRAPARGHRASDVVTTRRPKRNQLSLRFFAAPLPNHPVVMRLANACARLLDLMRDCDDACHLSTQHISLQLQQVLADDAWAVRFVPENDVFGEERGVFIDVMQ
jgi:GR25 family glycosyltransferase involved in LPS biosynthesis